ncbi:MAG: flippase [Rhodobacter sp.]|nr:flippase [Rhodobacter sp.]
MFGSVVISQARTRILKSGGWLIAKQLISMLNTLVLAVLIARHLGPEQYGVLSYAVSLVALAAPLTTMGLRNLSLREFKLHPDETGRILGTVTVMRLCGTLLSVAVVYAVASRFPIPHEHIAILCLILAGAALFKTIDTIQEYFIADQNPRPFVIYSVFVLLTFSLIKVGLIVSGQSVNAFILANAGQTVAQSLGVVIAYRRFSGVPPGFSVDLARVPRYLKQAFPLMLGAVSAVIYLKIDILFLSYMAGKEVTGIYSVAARLSEAWYMLPATLALAAFPRMVELRSSAPKRYARRMQDAMDVFAAFGTLVAASSFFWAKPMIALLFGAAYLDAVFILQLYVWVGIVVATRALIHKWLLAEALFWGSATIHMTGATLNVGLNLLLIPIYGAAGAAVATVISYTLAPLLLAPVIPSLRPVAVMQIKAIFWPRRIAELLPRRARLSTE